MANNISYGTLKIKNRLEELDSFYPHVLTSQVMHYSKNETISETLEEIDKKIDIDTSEYGDIKTTKEEPTNANAVDDKIETMFIYFPYPDVFKFTTSNPVISVPFDMYGTENCSFEVNWGDGTTETFASSDFIRDITNTDDFDYYEDISYQKNGRSYSVSTVTPASHLYEDGLNTHTITVSSKQFDEMYWLSVYQAFIESVLTPIPVVKGIIYFWDGPITGVNGWFTKYVKKDNSLEYAFSYNDYYGSTSPSLINIPSNLFSYNANITSVAGAFNGCINLASIPSGLFDDCDKITNFNACFKECKSIESIPSNLFDICIDATDFSYCFSYCNSLTEIPENLFKNCKSATNFSYCFIYCTVLPEIPKNLFMYNTNATNFSSCFQGCSSLASIPSGLFDNCPNVTEFSGCFEYCSSLISIPERLFDNNIAVTRFYSCFWYCTALTTIPENLFRYNTNVIDFRHCFYKCNALTDFNLYIYSKNVTDVAYFIDKITGVQRNIYVPANSTTYNSFNNAINDHGCTIIPIQYWSYTIDTEKAYKSNRNTSIPFDLYNVNDASIYVDWGDNTTSIFTSANYSYSNPLNNSSSTSLIHTYSTSGIYDICVYSLDFDKIKLYNSLNTKSGSPIYNYRNTIIRVNNAFPTLNVTDFTSCFAYCTSLTSIPEKLFDNNINVTSFENCFSSCSKLTSISQDLFRYHTNVTSFESCFLGCSSLTEIPSGLFDNNINVTNFTDCFYLCLKLTSIPSGLFDNNINVTSFGSCFGECSKITSIPTDIFRYNTAVTTFTGCFYCCTLLTSIPQDLFKYNTSVTSFEFCFYNCLLLNDFTIHIGSALVNSISYTAYYNETWYFIQPKENTSRIIYVPNNSTTKATFDAEAETLGLTIIGE